MLVRFSLWMPQINLELFLELVQCEVRMWSRIGHIFFPFNLCRSHNAGCTIKPNSIWNVLHSNVYTSQIIRNDDPIFVSVDEALQSIFMKWKRWNWRKKKMLLFWFSFSRRFSYVTNDSSAFYKPNFFYLNSVQIRLHALSSFVTLIK